MLHAVVVSILRVDRRVIRCTRIISGSRGLVIVSTIYLLHVTRDKLFDVLLPMLRR